VAKSRSLKNHAILRQKDLALIESAGARHNCSALADIDGCFSGERNHRMRLTDGDLSRPLRVKATLK